MKALEIISPEFFVFVLVSLGVYHVLPQQYKKVFLLLISYAFYATWGTGYLIVLLLFTVINYFLAKYIEINQSVWVFRFSVFLNGFSFLLLKGLAGPYGKRFLSIFLDAVRAGNLTAVLLPIGFSFYVLQGISYLVDVYRRQIPAEKDFIDLALYFAYFLKMLAGPIERAKGFLADVKRDIFVRGNEVEEGLYLILIGLLRKVVISDRLNLFLPSDLFTVPVNYLFFERVFWLLIFAFILYNDFAGYSSIVRGISLLFGIKLKINFMQPMFSRSFSDFWTRWHISLSEWLRDYIFFPARRFFSKKRANFWVTLIVPPLLTMVFSGYWHGAYLSVIAWGALHGLYLVVEQILLRKKILPLKEQYNWLYSLIVFIGATFAWIFFAARGLGAVQAFLLGDALVDGWTVALASVFEMGLLVIVSLWFDVQELKTNDLAFPRRWSLGRQGWLTAGMLVTLFLALSIAADLSGFVYQGF